jgi:hypothetical protein
MRAFDLDPSITRLPTLERPPPADHGAAPVELASASSAIDRGSDDEAHRQSRCRASFQGELDAGLLGPGEPNARGALGAYQTIEPNTASLTELDEGDRDVDLTEGDPAGIALGGRRTLRPDMAHASNVFAAPRGKGLRERSARSTGAQQSRDQASLTRYPTPGSDVIRSRNSPPGSAAAILRRSRLT